MYGFRTRRNKQNKHPALSLFLCACGRKFRLAQEKAALAEEMLKKAEERHSAAEMRARTAEAQSNDEMLRARESSLIARNKASGKSQDLLVTSNVKGQRRASCLSFPLVVDRKQGLHARERNDEESNRGHGGRKAAGCTEITSFGEPFAGC